jgi:hypothetical protein
MENDGSCRTRDATQHCRQVKVIEALEKNIGGHPHPRDFAAYRT